MRAVIVERICDCGCERYDARRRAPGAKIPLPDAGEWIEVTEDNGMTVLLFASWACFGRWLRDQKLTDVILGGIYGNSRPTT